MCRYNAARGTGEVRRPLEASAYKAVLASRRKKDNLWQTHLQHQVVKGQRLAHSPSFRVAQQADEGIQVSGVVKEGGT